MSCLKRRKQFFFEKKNQKTFVLRSFRRRVLIRFSPRLGVDIAARIVDRVHATMMFFSGKKDFLGAHGIFPKARQRAPRLPHRLEIALSCFGLPAQYLHAPKTFRERQEPQARGRTAALMQGGEACLGGLRKRLGRRGKTLNPLGEDQHKFVQALPAHGRRNSGDPCRVYRV